MPLVDNTFTGSGSDPTTWDDTGNWSLNVLPASTHRAKFDANTATLPAFNTSPVVDVGAILVVDGGGLGSFLAADNARCIGTFIATNLEDFNIYDTPNALTSADVAINHATGIQDGTFLWVLLTGKIWINSNADIQVLQTNGGGTDGQITCTGANITFELGNQWVGTAICDGGVVSVDENSHGGDTVTYNAKNSGTINFNSGLLPANVNLLASAGGYISNFTQLRASGQQAKYATVTGGVERSHASGGTYSGTYDQSFGTTPTQLSIGSNTYGEESGFTASGGVWSIPLTDGMIGSGQDVTLIDFGNSIILNLDTITVTAAASGASPANKLSLGGLSLSL